MLKKIGYTLIEILVVLVIIATLAALAWPNYTKIKEKSMNREAKASLALIRAAEKVYRLEQGFYYPYAPASVNTASTINSDLKLSLPDPGTNWSVSITTTDVDAGSATSTRKDVSGPRYWTHDFSNEEPTCTNGGTDKNCP